MGFGEYDAVGQSAESGHSSHEIQSARLVPAHADDGRIPRKAHNSRYSSSFISRCVAWAVEFQLEYPLLSQFACFNRMANCLSKPAWDMVPSVELVSRLSRAKSSLVWLPYFVRVLRICDVVVLDAHSNPASLPWVVKCKGESSLHSVWAVRGVDVIPRRGLHGCSPFEGKSRENRWRDRLIPVKAGVCS